jgi:hypothetical protein
MEGSNGAPFAVGDKDRNTVGGLDGEQQARFVGHHSVGFPAGFFARVFGGNAAGKRGMNLAESDHWEGWIAGNFAEKAPAVFEDIFPGIWSGKSEVQLASALAGSVDLTFTASPGAESADKPVDFGKERGAKDFNTAFDQTLCRALPCRKLPGMLGLTLKSAAHELSAAVAKANGCQKLIDFLNGSRRFRRFGHRAILRQGLKSKWVRFPADPLKRHVLEGWG